MSSYLPVTVSNPRLFTHQVLELWNYQWNAAQQTYERVSFRALHMMEPEENPVDHFDGGEFLPPRPVLVGELLPAVQRRLVPPPRPPPPNFSRRGTSPESPASPDPSSGIWSLFAGGQPHEDDHSIAAHLLAQQDEL